MDLIDRVKVEIGTRSESREGTRWMGKHVGVDFVDQPICPTDLNQLHQTCSFCLFLTHSSSLDPLLHRKYETAERERESTHEIGGLAAIL